MKILVRDIKAKGLRIHQEVPPQSIGLMEEDMKCLSPVVIKSDLTKTGSTVTAVSQIKVALGRECARCLEPLNSDFSDTFQHTFDIGPMTETIDLGEEIRQELILGYDPVVLCKPDCKGLCHRCGANLNVEKCRCRK